MVDARRLSPTFTADLAVALVAAVEAGTTGVLHLTAAGECSWFEFTEAIMQLAGLRPAMTAVETTPSPGGADRPLNGVLANARAATSGLTPLRHWRDALEDYMVRAGITAR